MLKSKRTNYKKPRKEPVNQKKTFFTKENLFISRMASILMVLLSVNWQLSFLLFIFVQCLLISIFVKSYVSPIKILR